MYKVIYTASHIIMILNEQLMNWKEDGRGHCDRKCALSSGNTKQTKSMLLAGYTTGQSL